jgi:hypothetical protein
MMMLDIKKKEGRRENDFTVHAWLLPPSLWIPPPKIHSKTGNLLNIRRLREACLLFAIAVSGV